MIPTSNWPFPYTGCNAPVVDGKALPNTIPPAKKAPPGPGVAVKPQLLTLLPVNVENTIEGSMISVALGSVSPTEKLTVFPPVITYRQLTSVRPFLGSKL